jgi:hypothetical protein
MPLLSGIFYLENSNSTIWFNTQKPNFNRLEKRYLQKFIQLWHF